MTKRTKVLSGEAARKYFRALFSADPGQSPASASRLADTCVREIAELRVRLPAVASRTSSIAGLASAANKAPPVAVSDSTVREPAAAGPTTAVGVAQVVPHETQPQPERVAESLPIEPVFDPFEFSLIVALRRDGRAALLARLIAIGDTGRLREIAKAQHVSITDVGMPGVGIPADTGDVEALATAIVAGTERRVAHREAAAS